MNFKVAFVTVLLCTWAVRADEKIDVAKAVEQAKVVSNALLKDDYGKLADLIHPKIIEQAGGRDKFIDAVKVGRRQLKDLGVTIKSYSIGKPQEPVIDGRKAYLVILTTMVRESEGTKETVESYLLGMTTDRGKTWVFVDGAGMENQDVKDKIFPELPAGLKLPEKKEPTVIKD